MEIRPGDLSDPRVRALLDTHAATARAMTEPGSAHALDLAGFEAPDIRLWTIWAGETLLGTGALRTLDARHGEIKAMHTAAASRRLGAGGTLLRHIIAVARAEGLTRLSLETGVLDYFRPAHALYRRHGFSDCAPFGAYRPDPNSLFLTLMLED